MSVSTLPDEILLHIFSFLPAKDYTRAKFVCKSFKIILENGWRYLKKPLISSIEIDYLDPDENDSNPRLAVEIYPGSYEEVKMLITPSEIRMEESWELVNHRQLTEETQKKMMKNPFHVKRHRKIIALRKFLAIGIGCGNFSHGYHPAAIQSMEHGLELVLRAILRYSNASSLKLSGRGYWTPINNQKVLELLKDTRASADGLCFETDQISDSMVELIRFSNCKYLQFGGLSEQTEFNRGQNSVDQRIRRFFQKELIFYTKDLVSVETMLFLLQQWRSGERDIESIRYDHTNHHFDWFAPMSKFTIVTPPYDHIWTMNATIHVKTFAISREDGRELEINYYTYHDSSYMEVKKRWSKAEIEEMCRKRDEEENAKQAAHKERVEDLEEDLMGFGLFD